MNRIFWFALVSLEISIQLTSLTEAAESKYPKEQPHYNINPPPPQKPQLQPNKLGYLGSSSTGGNPSYNNEPAGPHQGSYFPGSKNYPNNPLHYTPGYVPNRDPEHTKETHVVYNNQNLPHIATASNETARIGGDRSVQIWEYPHHIQIRNRSSHLCGGSLVISPSTGRQLVITAGHCAMLDGTKPQEYRPLHATYLRAGNLYRDGEQGQRMGIKKILVHPEGSKNNFRDGNDIAIVFPETEFQLNFHVKPIQLPRQGQPLLSQHVTVTGWGYGRDGDMSKMTDQLKVVDIPIVDNNLCRKLYHRENGGVPGEKLITDNHFCAGFIQGGVDTCFGDSGGPTIAMDNHKAYLAGVVNWGKGCARARYPGVYAKVSSYIDWIARESYNYQELGIQ